MRWGGGPNLRAARSNISTASTAVLDRSTEAAAHAECTSGNITKADDCAPGPNNPG